MMSLGSDTMSNTSADAAVETKAAETQPTKRPEAQREEAPQPTETRRPTNPETRKEQPKREERKVMTSMQSGIGRTVVSTSSATESVAQYVKAATAAMTNHPLKISVNLVDSSRGMSMPAVVFNTVSNNKNFYYTVMLECAGQRLDNEVEVRRGHQYEVDMVASDAFDDDYCAVIESHLARVTGVEESVPVAIVVVKQEDDLLSDEVRNSTIVTAAIALEDALSPTPGAPVVDAKVLTEKKLQIGAYMEAVDGVVTDSMGRAVAADFVINVDASSNQARYRPNQRKTREELCTTTGVVDFTYVEPNNRHSNRDNAQPAYYTDINLTSSFSLDAKSGTTTESVMTHILAAATASPLAAEQGWVRLFAERPNTKASLGALALEYSPYPGTQVPDMIMNMVTGPAKGDDEANVYDFARAYCHEVTTISSTFEQGARESWSTNPLVAAAHDMNGTNGDNAYVLGLMDDFVGGIFREICEERGVSTNLFTNVSQVHIGHYPDANGNTRSIGEDTYLPMLTELADCHEDFERYAETFGSDDEVDLDVRRNYYTGMRGATITGMADKLTWNNELLEAFVDALTEAGINISPEGILRDNQGTVRGSRYRQQNHAISGNSVRGQFRNARRGDEGGRQRSQRGYMARGGRGIRN